MTDQFDSPNFVSNAVSLLLHPKYKNIAQFSKDVILELQLKPKQQHN